MQIRWAYLKRVLAGAIFGLYMAHLLYFLNPQVDINPGRLATVTLIYGLTCGLLFGTALWGLRALRVKVFGKRAAGTYRAHGFGFVVLAAFISTAIYWFHLQVIRIGYLPIGAVRVLAKATNLITATAFALLLLWVIERSADRITSRAIFLVGVVLIAISSFFLYQRRDRYRTEKQSVVVANIGTVAGRRPVILIAIQNLPYDWILTMTGEGSLPFFQQARDHAFFTRLEPFPSSSPKALWASVATGKLPYRHGVTGRFSYRTPLNGRDPSDRFLLLPSGVGFEAWGLIPPVQRISATLPAGDSMPLWTLFERVSFHTAVIGWPQVRGGASHVISDVAIDAERPAELAKTRDAAQRFNATGPARTRIVAGLADDDATANELRAAAASRAFALDAAYFDGFGETQRALHIITNELPPRSTMKGEVLRAYAAQIDRMLAAIAREHPDHLLVVVSPSGPVAKPLPASALSYARDLFVTDDPGADDGFFLMYGPGAAHRDRASSAVPTDVVPTILFAAGLPIGRDMDGKVLSDAFTDDALHQATLSLIQTYEAPEVVVKHGGQ